jgi:transposase
MYYVGIDIAKSFHVVSLIDDEETKVISKPFKINNDSKGFDKLLTIFVKCNPKMYQYAEQICTTS